MKNAQNETNLHNAGVLFNSLPRYLMGFGVLTGGLGVPLAAAFYPKLRASLFLPPAASKDAQLMPEIGSTLGLRLMRPVRARLFMLARAYRNWG